MLLTETTAVKRKVASFAPLIDRRADALLSEVRATYQLAAAQRGVAAAEPTQAAEEREASRLLVKRGPKAPAPGMRPPPAPGPLLPDEYMAEFQILVNRGDMTVLQMRDFLSGEFTPLPLADLMAVLKAREAAGQVKLIRR